MGLDMSLYVQETKNGDFEEVGYWRKANAIHGFFVDKCYCNKYYDYDDYDGTEVEVSEETIEELRDLCIEVKTSLENVASIGEKLDIIDTKLPMRDGFFFGYDRSEGGVETYMYHLDETIKIMEKVLKLIKEKKCYKIFYGASW